MKKKFLQNVNKNFILLKSESKIKTFEDLVTVKFNNFRLVAIKKEGDYFGEIALE